MERNLVLKDNVSAEDVKNLILCFLDSCHEDDSDSIQCKLWEEFYNNMTVLK